MKKQSWNVNPAVGSVADAGMIRAGRGWRCANVGDLWELLLGIALRIPLALDESQWSMPIQAESMAHEKDAPERAAEGEGMKPYDLLKDLISPKFSIINYHEEGEESGYFSAVGSLVDGHGIVFNFEFYNSGKLMDWQTYSLRLIDKSIGEAKVVRG